MKILFTFFTVFTLLFFYGCTKGIEKNSSGLRTEQNFPSANRRNIPPDHCDIIGTVVKIDSSLEQNENDPCSKYPCVAEVKIDSVLGYGAGFPGMVINGIVKMKFAFTLGPADSTLFPKLNASYPGLHAGNKFSAEIAFNRSLNRNNNIKYVVYAYHVK